MGTREDLVARAMQFNALLDNPLTDEQQFTAIMEDFIEPSLTKPYRIKELFQQEQARQANPAEAKNLATSMDDVWLSQDKKRGYVRISTAWEELSTGKVTVRSRIYQWKFKDDVWYRTVENPETSITEAFASHIDILIKSKLL